MWVEAQDLGGPWRSRQHDDRPHGLDLVEALTGPDGWGVEPTSDGGRVVWARLDLTAGEWSRTSPSSSTARLERFRTGERSKDYGTVEPGPVRLIFPMCDVRGSRDVSDVSGRASRVRERPALSP